MYTGIAIINPKLKDAGLNVIEIEDGMLGYIKNNGLVKLPMTQTIDINGITIDCKDIYSEYYFK